MNNKSDHKLDIRGLLRGAGFSLIVVSIVLVFAVTALAATYIFNTTGAKPAWLNPGWRFSVNSDTNSGEAVCIQVHPKTDPGNYVRQQCSALGGVNWRCDVFTGGVSAAFKGKTVEYQYFIAKYDDANPCLDNNGGWMAYGWTGFGSGGTNFNNTPGNPDFQTGSTNAVTLGSMGAKSSLPVGPLAAAVMTFGGLGGLALRRRRK